MARNKMLLIKRVYIRDFSWSPILSDIWFLAAIPNDFYLSNNFPREFIIKGVLINLHHDVFQKEFLHSLFNSNFKKHQNQHWTSDLILATYFSVSLEVKVIFFFFLTVILSNSFGVLLAFTLISNILLYHEIVKGSCGSAAGHTTLILLFFPPYLPVFIRQHDRSMPPFLREHFTLAALWYLLILPPSLLLLPLGSHSFSLTMAWRPTPYISTHFPSPKPSTRQFTCQDGSCVCVHGWEITAWLEMQKPFQLLLWSGIWRWWWWRVALKLNLSELTLVINGVPLLWLHLKKRHKKVTPRLDFLGCEWHVKRGNILKIDQLSYASRLTPAARCSAFATIHLNQRRMSHPELGRQAFLANVPVKVQTVRNIWKQESGSPQGANESVSLQPPRLERHIIASLRVSLRTYHRAGL